MPGNILIFYLIAFAGIVYLMLIRPQQKRQKQVQSLQDSLQIGDAIVTIGGLHGTISELDTSTITIATANGGLLVFDRYAIRNKSDQVRKEIGEEVNNDIISNIDEQLETEIEDSGEDKSVSEETDRK